MRGIKGFSVGALKVVCFLLGLALLLSLSMNVLIFKQDDGTLPIRNFYDLPPDTVDVLFLGSSHVGMNISAQRLWDEYGIAGYKCWGSTQPVWNTYYYLRECLKYQTPKVVVFDVHSVLFSNEYADYVLQVKNTLGMRMSRDKLAAVRASAPGDMRINLLLGLPTYHMRYNELNDEDFHYFPWDRHTGITTVSNENMDIVFPLTVLEPDATEGSEALEAKEERYFRAIIELCRERGIALELICAPYQITGFEQKRLRTVGEIAAEYEGLRFTDYNLRYRDYGIDPAQDYLDPGHFNRYGVVKYTDAIAKLLADHALPDRRLDPAHIWNLKDVETAPVYQLDAQFSGDGKQAVLDTGLPLFRNALSSWTLLCSFDVPPAEDGDKVILSCYDETPEAFRGLLVNVDSNDRLTVRFSSYEDFHTDIVRAGQTITLAVVKNGKEIEAYVDGESLGRMKLENLAAYEGNLLLGAQQNEEGKYFRYSRPLIRDAQVYTGVMSERFIRAWQPRVLEKPETVSYLMSTDLPENTIYRLPVRFEGDGLERYADTGVALYRDPEASWTLLARIDPEIVVGDNVYLSCFLEDSSDYHGLLVRRPEPGVLNIVYGQGTGTTFPIPTDRPSSLAVLKDRNAYSIYLNGELVLDGAASPCGAYDGSLLIGCECTPEGERFRYSGTKVLNLEIIDALLTGEAVRQWQPEELPAPEREAGAPVAYRLATGFAGNGQDAALDTGRRLYDVSDKSWSLHAKIDLGTETNGTVLSCFAEDPSDYRGLLLRQIDDSTYGLTVGKDFCSLHVGPRRSFVLDLVKDGYSYSVYIDGELFQTLESRCRSWDGTLLLCSERAVNGRPFRFSRQYVRSLELYDGVRDAGEIAALYRADSQSPYRK